LCYNNFILMGALLTICLALTFLLTGQAQTAISKGENTKKTEQITDQEPCKTQCGSPTIIEKQTIYSGFSEKEKEKKTEQRANTAHDWIDNVNALSTAVIAGFTILLFVGVIWQVRTSRAIERAWVMADIEADAAKWRDQKLHVIEGSGTDGDTTAIYAALTCRNAGRTPAWIEKTVAKFEIVTTLPPIPNFEGAEYIEVGTIPLGMAGGDAVPHTQKLPWVPTASGHPGIGKMPVIYGFVEYRDIFKKQRVTTFGYRITHDGELKRLVGSPKYNEST